MNDTRLSDDEGSAYSDAEVAPPVTATKHIAQDKSLFNDWLRDQREDAYNSIREPYMSDEGIVKAVFNQMRPEEANIITSPREYQTELFERAKEKNIIAVLDTGTGKTLIAVLLLRYIVEQELENRKAGENHKLAFFLVDKVALVHQQYSVLAANLDFPMDSFTGDSGGQIYTRDFWDKAIDRKTVIVCTCEVLYHCLYHAFICMEQINLLIFDEAHHTKKNHPYARIIKDFYATLDKGKGQLPRILGMTASPVNAKTDVRLAAAQLEGLMHCEIATIDDPAVFLRAAISKPTEGIIEFTQTGIPFETALWKRLYQIVGQNKAFDELLEYSRWCPAELGRWAADRVWKLWLAKEEVSKIEAKIRRDFSLAASKNDASLDAEQQEVELVKQAYSLIEGHTVAVETLEIDQFHLSNKILQLIKHLEKNFDPELDKCIVFAERRLTVALLAEIFRQPCLRARGYRAGKLMGSRSNSTITDLGMTLTEQKSAIKEFRRGELNCLFATSAGEEGIDIPDCNLVIRFDLYKTVIQYIQSRGRARRSNSKFYEMVEIGNKEHAKLITDIRDHEEKLREFCSALPKDRLIISCDYNIEYHLAKEKRFRTYKVPSTGATLSYKSSTLVLAKFVSSLPRSANAVHQREDYIVHIIGGEFQCEVLLPDISPIRGAIGRRASSKQVAKCSAAFEMCLKLKKQKYLDDNLRSAFVKQLPAMRNARLAISSKKRDGYPMKRKPNAWSIIGLPKGLFVTVIRLSNPEGLGRSSSPLAIVTKEKLSRISSFPIYFDNQQTSDVECLSLSTSMEFLPSEIDGLNQFTLKIFEDVFSKEYESNVENMQYFFAPIKIPHGSQCLAADTDPRTIIDWQCLSEIQGSSGDVEWENQPESIFDNKFIVDPYDGSRKFFTIRRRPDVRSTDPQLPGLPKSRRGRQLVNGDGPLDIWTSLVVSLYPKTRNRLTRREDLLVVEAEYVSLRRNLLDPCDVACDTDQNCFLVFQTLKISRIPADIVAMAFNLPAIIYRLESNLIALEASNALGLDILPELALEAMTKDSDNTEEHTDEQINLQQGMGRNYERLEFLGDSFLKMGTTIALFSQIQDCDEFQYHVYRMLLICNKNLFNNALELGLQESIRTEGFNRSGWYPEGLTLLKGRKLVQPENHVLADKSIADVCEALIGAAYMTTRDEGNFDLATQAVTKFVNHKNHKMMTYDDYYAGYKIPEWQSAAPRAVHSMLAAEIEKKMGYKFKYPRLLRSAFTHPSYGTIYEGLPNYQRLEFLGDSLLDMACVDYLFRHFPGANPQWLTEHKMAMVSNQFLGCLCVSLGLQTHMVSITNVLPKEIADYATAITEARIQAEDEAEASGLGRAAYARNYWVDAKRPPKCLPDIVESYVGAVFVDSGFSYAEVQRFFDAHILPYFEDIHLYDTYATSQPVTLLSNTLSVRFHCRKWRIMAAETDDEEDSFAATKIVAGVVIHGAVRESAFADNSRIAKLKAANKMLRKLKDMEAGEFRKTFDCHCSDLGDSTMAEDSLATGLSPN